jgi:hypothetical protein
MFEKFINAIGARKKQIIWVLVIIGIFYLFSSWNIGGIISFFAFYDYGFGFLTANLGLNEWLARGILIPVVALTVWATSDMLSLTNKLRRRNGTIILITVLSLLSFAMYYYTKDAYNGTDLFSMSSGEPLKRFYEQPDYVEIFPKNIQYHPTTGAKLEILTSKKKEEFSQKKKLFRNSFFSQKDAAGSMRLFDKSTGESNFNYYTDSGVMYLYPKDKLLIEGKPQLKILSRQALESFKKQEQNYVRKKFYFWSNENGWRDTSQYILKGDLLYIYNMGCKIKIGENGETIDFPDKITTKINATSEGILFIAKRLFSSETYPSIEIGGLSILFAER